MNFLWIGLTNEIVLKRFLLGYRNSIEGVFFYHLLILSIDVLYTSMLINLVYLII